MLGQRVGTVRGELARRDHLDGSFGEPLGLAAGGDARGAVVGAAEDRAEQWGGWGRILHRFERATERRRRHPGSAAQSQGQLRMWTRAGARSVGGMTVLSPDPTGFVDADVGERLDAIVARAGEAAAAFRALDQEAVDRIVHAMVVAGVEHAVELAQLAMEETGFGVFEDKVVKNYVATEFLYDYLRGKRSVGVIEARPGAQPRVRRRADRRRARAAPDHQPDLDGAVQGDRRRQDPQRGRVPAVRPRGALRGAGDRGGPRGRRGARASRPDALQVVPDPTLDVSQYLFHHPGVDFIWTTGGPKAVRATNEAGKPCIGVGAGNAPVYVHRSADVPMAVMDILISKTFDASVICPAEQTLVVDDADPRRAGRRARAHGRPRPRRRTRSTRSPASAFEPDGRVRIEALGQSCASLAGLAGLAGATTAPRCCSRRCRPTSTRSRPTRWCRRS